MLFENNALIQTKCANPDNIPNTHGLSYTFPTRLTCVICRYTFPTHLSPRRERLAIRLGNPRKLYL